MSATRLRAIVVGALIVLLPGVMRAEPAISPPRQADNGFVVHSMQSEFQAGTTQIYVRMPAKPPADRLRVLYVLPVEAHDNDKLRWGDARTEVAALKLVDRYGVIVVFPTFSHLPWYADHASDLSIRQESYFLHVVLPFIERHYPASTDPLARLLLGFSKSGWGAWTLLLRHPELFGRAAAWDAPMTMDTPRYGMAPIVRTQENFERYRVTNLLRERGAVLGGEPRLMLAGWDFYRTQTQSAHRLMQNLKIPHAYRDGPQRRHHWNSGWVAGLADWVLR
jgi:S-formylglutathione hydrolase FrmB